MKKYEGAKAEKSVSREQLPAGGYPVKIISAKEEHYDWGDKMSIAFDVSDGPHKDFFKKDFDAQVGEDKKWRGVFRLYEPKDDGSDKDEWTKRAFNNFIYALEDSNPGFHLDWGPMEAGDFGQFKGKAIGMLFRNEEWEMETSDGYKTGWSSRPFMAISAGDIKDGKFKMPKDKPLKDKQGPSTSSGFAEISESTEDNLPF